MDILEFILICFPLFLLVFLIIIKCLHVFELKKRELGLFKMLLYVIRVYDFNHDNAEVRFCFDCKCKFNKSFSSTTIYFCPHCSKATYGFDNESFERFEIEYENLKNSKKIKNKESLELIDKFILILQQFKIDLESGDVDE